MYKLNILRYTPKVSSYEFITKLCFPVPINNIVLKNSLESMTEYIKSIKDKSGK